VTGILLGLVLGMTILVRPTEVICLLVPVLWGITSRETLALKWKLIKNNKLKILSIALSVMAVISLQLFYWKIQTGRFLYYSYESNEKLEFLARHLGEVLFSYKKGWLIYTPVMIFSLAGLFLLRKRAAEVFLSVLVFFIINLLIIASWTTWWFGGSIGQRSMMQSYSLLAFPLAAFLQWLTGRRWIVKGPLFFVILLMIFLNLFQTWQYMNFLIDPSRMTRKYYWAIFGKTFVSDKTMRYLEPVENNEKETLTDTTRYLRRTLAYFAFENSGSSGSSTVSRSGKYSFRLDKNQSFSPGIKIPYRELTHKDEDVWIRATGYIYFNGDPKSLLANLVVTCNHDGKNYKYRSVILEKENLLPGTWNAVTLDYLLPNIPDENDQLQIYFWYRGDQEIYLDDFLIRIFEPEE